MFSTSATMYLVYSALIVASVYGRNLAAPQEEINNDYFGRKAECQLVLMKSMADELLSEYNRVTLTNQKLYLLSREPNVICKESDLSSCIVSLNIQASSCDRLAPVQGCLVDAKNGERKTCVGVVDLNKPEMTSPLMCQNDITNDGERNRILQLQMSSLSNLQSQFTDKYIKRQWGPNGGNIYPL